jgi:hypothetical protein
MSKFEPSFTTTNNMVSHVSDISVKMGRLSVMIYMTKIPYTRKNNRKHIFIHYSK